MWDETDYEGRWVQGVCAIFLALFALIGSYVVLKFLGLFLILGGIPVIIGATRLCWRCAYYAVTGQKNVNRDNY
jgi:hypothetical protein